MTMSAILTLAATGILLAGAAWLLFFMVPQMAHSSMVLELSKLRTAICELGEEEPAVLAHPDVVRLDALLAQTLTFDRAPGMSALIASAIHVSRGVRGHEQLPVPPTFAGLGPGERLSLYLLMHRGSMAVIRGSILGSRFWFLSWPLWIAVQSTISGRETLQRGSMDDQQLTRVLTLTTRVGPPTQLQAA